MQFSCAHFKIHDSSVRITLHIFFMKTAFRYLQQFCGINSIVLDETLRGAITYEGGRGAVSAIHRAGLGKGAHGEIICSDDRLIVWSNKIAVLCETKQTRAVFGLVGALARA